MNWIPDMVWKKVGGNQEDMLSMEKFGGYKTEVNELVERGQRLALRKVEGGKHFRDIREVARRNWTENAFAWPNGLRENAETAVSCRGPGPARKKKEVYH